MASTLEPTGRRARPKPGRRRRLPTRRRARGLAGAIGITSLGALLPGTGFLYNGRKALGLAVLLPSLLAVGLAAWFFPRDLDSALDFAFDPAQLKTVAFVIALALIAWMLVVVTTYVVVRPTGIRRWQSVLGSVFVVGLCLAVAAPVTMAARYAMVQADLVDTVFGDNQSATTPDDVSSEDPWGGRDRVNLLLLGGDGGDNREGVRTDSMILVSMDTATGKTIMFSLPRNMMNAQFPADSPLHDLYPEGFAGEGDDGNWMLNAVYRQVPALHPGVLGKSDNEGADALKQAIAGSIGLPVDYYLLVNFEGFREIVDAMGGVTVNVNQPVAIGGNTTLGVEPQDWIDPGPEQQLDGFEALWFSRGRYGSDDYQRMERQRCMIDAIIDEADPLTLLRRYQALAEAGKEMVQTDIPRDLLPAFVDLAMDVKDKRVKSVVFRSSDEFYPGDPDFDWMQSVTRKALSPTGKKDKPGDKSGSAADNKDACAYDPVS